MDKPVCLTCGKPVIKAGFGWSGKVKRQLYLCTNQACKRFRIKTMKAVIK